MASTRDMPVGDLAQRLLQALPLVREWVEATIAHHQELAVAVNRMGYARLEDHFPDVLLERARAVILEEVPFPPLSRMGLPELAAFEAMPVVGVTYKDVFFVQGARLTEGLCCHELVHVVQWDTLGVDRFLLAYGLGLLRFGYRESPLEEMAYAVQTDFEKGSLSAGLMGRIRRGTDEIWSEAGSRMAEMGLVFETAQERAP